MADHQPLQDGAVDPNVVIPKHIRDAAVAADALHKQVYQEPAPIQDAPKPATEPEPAPPAPVAAPEQTPPEHAPQPAPTAATPANDVDENSQSWKHRFLSMQGRWQASQKQLGEMSEINAQLAGELQATQQMIEQRRASPQQQPNHNTQHERLITPQDIDTYGQELLDVVQRAAREAVNPEIDALKGENAELKKRVITTGQRDVQVALTRAVPDWVAINRSPEFAQWLSLRNIYTGQVRRELLNGAYQAANAAVVVQLFKDFLTEVKATGGTPPVSQRQQQQPPVEVAPRQPAMQLETLAAPGRARPAPGDSSVPAEKPLYTHAQISRNYESRRRGAYAGRDAEWNALEADMIAAGREGRVR